MRLASSFAALRAGAAMATIYILVVGSVLLPENERDVTFPLFPKLHGESAIPTKYFSGLALAVLVGCIGCVSPPKDTNGESVVSHVLVFCIGFALASFAANPTTAVATYSSPQQYAPGANLSLPFVDVVVGIPCIAGNRLARDSVRQAWARLQTHSTVDIRRRVLVRFLIGRVDSMDLTAAVAAEAREHGDVLMLSSGDDVHFKAGGLIPKGYDPTSHKVFLFLQWATQHYRFRFAVRSSDDAYLRLDKLLEQLDATDFPQEKLYWGRFQYTCRNEEMNNILKMYHDNKLGNGSASSSSASRSSDRECWPPPRSMASSYAGGMFLYVPYATGTAYVLSHDVAAWIARSTLPFRFVWPEDAVVGLWIAGLDLAARNDLRFHDRHGRGGHQDSCGEQSILIHYMTPELWGRIDACGCLACGPTGRCPPCP